MNGAQDNTPETINIDRFSLQVTGDDMLGYKVVNFIGNKGRIAGVRVLLHMQIPASARVYDSLKHSLTTSLSQGTKYCTDKLRVEGVQLFGDTATVKAALLLFQQSQGRLESSYGVSPGLYTLGRGTYEPKAGEGKPNSCGPGLHFYSTQEEALANYGGDEVRGLPIITNRIRADQLDDRQCLKQTYPQNSLIMTANANSQLAVWKTHSDQFFESISFESTIAPTVDLPLPADSALARLCASMKSIKYHE